MWASIGRHDYLHCAICIIRVWGNWPIGKESNHMDVCVWLTLPPTSIMGNHEEALWEIMQCDSFTYYQNSNWPSYHAHTTQHQAISLQRLFHIPTKKPCDWMKGWWVANYVCEIGIVITVYTRLMVPILGACCSNHFENELLLERHLWGFDIGDIVMMSIIYYID